MHPTSTPPRVIKSSEDFVIVRLSTGESILAIRLKEDEKENPQNLKLEIIKKRERV